MNRDTILGVLSDKGFGQHAAAVEALMQPAVHIVAEGIAGRPGTWSVDQEADPAVVEKFDAALDALPIGASRFGGLPDLPAGTPWPDRDGVPMEFVAQLRLADVAPLDPLARLPGGGSLAFFYNSQWASSDMEPDARCAAVIYVPDGVALERTPPPRVEFQGEYDSTPRLAPFLHGLATLRFVPYTSIPGGISPYIQGPLRDMWQDFTAYNNAAYEPPGPANHLLGYIDGQDYAGAHKHGTDDQLLLQVDSDDAAEFQWGDCDRLYFVVTKAELAARDFSNVRLYSILG
jgi:uncharacterized protein YwqG